MLVRLSLFVLATSLVLSACAPAPDTEKLAEVDAQFTEPSVQETKSETVTATKPAKFSPLSDIGSRKAGEDWPDFLGRTRNSKSTQTGFKPNESPKVRWRRKFGEGYGIGSIARGRYFQFFRDQDEVILECMKA